MIDQKKQFKKKAREIEDLFAIGNSQLTAAMSTMKLVKEKIRDLKDNPSLYMLPEGFVEQLLGGFEDETRN
jgi:chromosome segregation and condensation protein ScpB